MKKKIKTKPSDRRHLKVFPIYLVLAYEKGKKLPHICKWVTDTKVKCGACLRGVAIPGRKKCMVCGAKFVAIDRLQYAY